MKVNEIFYSLQGEGVFTGTPAVFVRLSGCNLRCDFCDTRHEDGQEMTEKEIVERVTAYPARHVVVTGGEPTMQLTASLIEMLHEAGRYVQIETNGMFRLSEELITAIDWVTCSPKNEIPPQIQRIDELKVVFDIRRKGLVEHYEQLSPEGVKVWCLQPCDRADEGYNRDNLTGCIDYILSHPRWRLSLQTHKIVNIQ